MSHARVEELSDSDSDPDVMDITALPTAQARAAALMKPQDIPASQPQRTAVAPPPGSKNWHVLYPIYFDASVSRVEGRRVGKELAVKNPLALTIANAIQLRGLYSYFEPVKRHPKDWANPGRIKIRLRDEDGNWVAKGIKNSE